MGQCAAPVLGGLGVAVAAKTRHCQQVRCNSGALRSAAAASAVLVVVGGRSQLPWSTRPTRCCLPAPNHHHSAAAPLPDQGSPLAGHPAPLHHRQCNPPPKWSPPPRQQPASPPATLMRLQVSPAVQPAALPPLLLRRPKSPCAQSGCCRGRQTPGHSRHGCSPGPATSPGCHAPTCAAG